MKFPAAFFLALYSIALIAQASFDSNVSQKSPWRGTIEYRNGIAVVSNPERPLYQGEILKLDEDLTIGAAGSKTGGLVNPWYLTVDSEGKIYVMDQGDDCVKVYSGNGGFLRSVGRKGQGPGELENPNSIHVLDNFDFVFEDFNRGLNYFGKDGAFKRFVPTSGMINVWVMPDGRLAARVNTRKDDVAGKEIRYCEADLKPISTLLFLPDPPRDPSVSRPFAPGFSWAVTTGDRLAIAYKADYEIEVIGLRDSAKRVIKRAGDRVKVSPDELATAKKNLRGRTLDAPSVHPAVQDLLADDEGRMIVKTFEKTKDGSSVYYDVFDRDGIYLAKVPISVKIHPHVWQKEFLYGLEEDAEGNPLVKRYRVSWNFVR